MNSFFSMSVPLSCVVLEAILGRDFISQSVSDEQFVRRREEPDFRRGLVNRLKKAMRPVFNRCVQSLSEHVQINYVQSVSTRDKQLQFYFGCVCTVVRSFIWKIRRSPCPPLVRPPGHHRVSESGALPVGSRDVDHQTVPNFQSSDGSASWDASALKGFKGKRLGSRFHHLPPIEDRPASWPVRMKSSAA